MLFLSCLGFSLNSLTTLLQRVILRVSLLRWWRDFLILSNFGKSSVFQNVQACVSASIVNNLDASMWRYDVSSCNLIPPLSYFPRSVIYTLTLIQDLKIQPYHIQDLRVLESETYDNANSAVDSVYFHLRQEKIPLLKCFTVEDILRVIFPPSSQWTGNFFDLVYLLHREGVKLRPIVEKTYSSLRSNSFVAKVESQISHDVDALFGNLFSEGSRSLCSIEPNDQPPVSASSNLPFRLLIE